MICQCLLMTLIVYDDIMFYRGKWSILINIPLIVVAIFSSTFALIPHIVIRGIVQIYRWIHESKEDASTLHTHVIAK